MSFATRVLPVLALAVVAAACGAFEMQGGKGAHHKLRITVYKNGEGKCISRTVPKHHEVIIPDEDEIVWEIKEKDNCLEGKNLVIKWTTGNATNCSEITTDKNGNKNQIQCDLGSGAVKDSHHVYKLYLRPASGPDELIEDPDVDIVMF